MKTLKGLQDQLGRFQDREVQANRCASSRRRSRAGDAMAMGVLVEGFMEEEAAARAEFADRFAAFAGKSQRRTVKDTFG